MKPIDDYIHDVAVGLDQFVNTIFAGYPDETISARSYRLRNESLTWRVANEAIDLLFAIDRNHSQEAYQAEKKHEQGPVEYQ
jgi:hypothetical protein